MEKEKFESPARLRFIPLPRADDGEDASRCWSFVLGHLSFVMDCLLMTTDQGQMTFTS
jgi:hypothetical protein